jgi:hypothetical protein
LVAGLPLAYGIHPYPKYAYFVLIGAIPAVLIVAWIAFRVHAAGPAALLTRHGYGLEPAPSTGLAVLCVAMLGVAGVGVLDLDRAPDYEVRLLSVERDLAAVKSNGADRGLSVATLEARIGDVEQQQTQLSGEVLGVQAERAAPELEVVDAACDGDLPTRVDVDLKRPVRGGYHYWALRSDAENPGSYPVGPPRLRDQAPQLVMSVPMPICGRVYRLQVIECDERGDEDIRAVVSQGVDATITRLPSGCVEVVSGDFQAGVK